MITWTGKISSGHKPECGWVAKSICWLEYISYLQINSALYDDMWLLEFIVTFNASC